MIWQDVVFSIGNILFTIALVPSIADSYGKPNITTSFITASILLTFSISFFTLGLYSSSVSSLFTSSGWWILFFQRLVQNKNRLGVGY